MCARVCMRVFPCALVVASRGCSGWGRSERSVCVAQFGARVPWARGSGLFSISLLAMSTVKEACCTSKKRPTARVKEAYCNSKRGLLVSMSLLAMSIVS